MASNDFFKALTDPMASGGKGYANTSPPGGDDLANYYRNYTPEAGFYSYLQGKGMLGVQPQDRYAQSRYSAYYGRYLADAANNPNLGFYDYLKQQNYDPQAEYYSQSPDQRFDFSSRLLTPRARWVNLG